MAGVTLLLAHSQKGLYEVDMAEQDRNVLKTGAEEKSFAKVPERSRSGVGPVPRLSLVDIGPLKMVQQSPRARLNYPSTNLR